MKRIFTLLFFAICIFSNMHSVAQQTYWEWAKKYTGFPGYYGFNNCTDSNGNSYVTGIFATPTIIFGTDTLTSAGGYEVFIVKYDASGNVIWAKSGGGSGMDVSKSINIDDDGNVYVTGFFESPSISFDGMVLTRAGLCDIFVTKFDSFGNALWISGASGSSYMDIASGIGIDTTGNVFIAGSYFGNLIFGTDTLTSTISGSTDIFVVKYNASGNFQWAKSAGGHKADSCKSMCADVNGNVFITGKFKSDYIDFGGHWVLNAHENTDDIFIVKYDCTGNVVWAQGGGDDNSDYGTGINLDNKGNVYVIGSFQGPYIYIGATTLTNNYPVSHDIFIAKYDSLGNGLWAQSIGETLDDYGNSISIDASGNAYATGYFKSPTISFGGNTITNAGIGDVFVAKYDSLGNVIWAKNVGGINADAGYNISVDAIGDAFVSGNFFSPTILFGIDTLTNPYNNNDIYFAKLGLCSYHTIISSAGSTTFCPGDSVLLDAGPAQTYAWSTGDINQSISVSATGNYSVSTTDGLGCYSGDTISVNILLPYNNEQICIVTVDSSLHKNKIVWEKTSGVKTAFYKILKESTFTGVYDSIGIVPYDSMSVFVDTSSHPDQVQARYRILVIDSCGNESDTSILHQTIHLAVSVGVPSGHQLDWNAYMGNFSFGTYYIYAGTSPTNMVKIDSVATTVLSRTYPSPPVGQKYYFIAVKKADTCRATSSAKDQTQNVSTSISNMEEYQIFGIEESQNNLFDLYAYPNPFENSISISYKLLERTKVNIEIYNVLQEKVTDVVNTTQSTGNYKFEYKNEENRLANGVYYIRALFNDNGVIRKVIKL